MRTVYLSAIKLLLALFFFFGFTSGLFSQQTLTTITGWNAYVHLPDDYNSTGSKTYPLILFFPGIGEVGTDASKLLLNGPGNFLASGWNGNVVVNGTAVKPIIISLQPPTGYPPVVYIDAEIEAIKKLYRVDPNRINLTGLSQGGWMAEMYAMAYPDKIASIVPMTAVKPDDNPSYPSPFANYASDCGHALEYEQVNDFRDMQTIVNTMNKAVAGSAVYIQTNVGGGGHCCWNTWYDPTNTQSYSLNGFNGNWTIYQYMLTWSRCTATPPAGDAPPTVWAGNAQTITLTGGPTSSQSASFNFSNSPQSISGWTNMHGQPGSAVVTASAGGITLSSVAPSNWAPYSGTTSYDGGGVNAAGFFGNAAVSVNNWHQYGDPQAVYNENKPQLQAYGLTPGASYTVKMSGSNNFSLDANPTQYRIVGAAGYGPISENLDGTADNGATFTGVTADASGAIYIFINSVAGVSQLAQINGLQIISSAGSGMNVAQKSTAAAPVTTASTTLSGSASGNSGATITSTKWSQLSGPSATIASPSNLSTAVSDLMPGTYVFQLTATDNHGMSNSSNVSVTVNSTALSLAPPTVSAGNAQTVALAAGATQSASFNFSNSPQSISGWTNMHGQPGSAVVTASAGGITLSSVAPSNWAPYSGTTSYDGGGVNAAGFFGNAAVSVNNWHQYGDPQAVYNENKPQLQAYGLTPGASYTVKMSGSNNFSLDANPTQYRIVGAAGYGPISENLDGTADNGATFTGVTADASGAIYIFINSVAGVSQLAQINGLQITPSGSAQPGSVTLTGSASGNSGATIQSTSWSEISGPTATIAAPSNLSTAVSGLTAGSYVFQLKATDNNGQTATSTVTVTVSGSKAPPTVSAGNAQTVALAAGATQSASFNFSNSPQSISGWTNMHGQPGSAVVTASAGGITLSSVAPSNWAPYSGTTSYDGGGVNAAGFFGNAAVSVNNWHQYGDPQAVYNENKPQLQAYGLTPGASYTVKMSGSNNFSLDANPTQYRIVGAAGYGPISENLDGTADNGATFTGVTADASGAIYIFINSVAGVSQLAQINGLQITPSGSAQPGSVTLTGSASGNSGATIQSTSWSEISGPTATIAAPSNLSTAVSGLTAGSYVFQLKATDNNGQTATSNVTVTVSGSKAPPTVSAGNALAVTLPTNNLTLSGSASANNGATIQSIVWSKLSGGAATITSSSALNTTVTGLAAGNYTFQLTATDNNGLSTTSAVAVTVNAASGGSGGCGCDITLSPNPADGQVYLDGQTLGVKPGMTVCLKSGHYVSIGLFHFYGTPTQPVTIINCGGQVNVSGYVGYGFALHSSRYVRVTGTGDAGYKYGILLDGSAGSTVGFAEDEQSSDVEVDHLEVSKTAGIGIACAPTPNCDPSTWSSSWKMYNMSFHDNYVHETLDEGFYIGNTQNDYDFTCSGSNVTVHPQQIDTLRFYNNILDKDGWTSAQISQITGFLDMHDNSITNYGYANQTQHQAGIIVGAQTRGRIYNNKVIYGTGNALQVFGSGLSEIYNNIFAYAGNDGTAQGQNAIEMDDRPAPAGSPGLKVNFVNNTIINPRRNGISFYDDYHTVAPGGIIANNLITAPGFLPSPAAYIDLQDNVPVGISNNLTLLTTALGGFVNSGSNDFHLAVGSPAINTGINTASYGVTQDIDGVARPYGGAFDVGAYEFLGTGTSGMMTAAVAGMAMKLADSVAIAGGLEKLIVYPNPAKNIINVDWNSSYSGPALLALYDPTGKIIREVNFVKSPMEYNNQLIISDITPGVYLLVIKLKDGRRLTQKVLKR